MIGSNHVKCEFCGQMIDEWFPFVSDSEKIYHRECHKHVSKFIKFNGKADHEYKELLKILGESDNITIWGVKSYEKPGVVSDERIENIKKITEDAARFAAMEGTEKETGDGDGAEKEG